MRFLCLAFGLVLCASQAVAAPKVLTSIQPLQLIAERILGEQGETEVLLPPGASPHSFTLRPSDSRRFAAADAFFWIGPDMENFLIKLVERKPKQSHAIQKLSGLELLYYSTGHDHAEGLLEDEEEEHAPAAELKEHDHHHQPGGLDTHLWLSTLNARVIAARMADEFVRLEPEAAEHYQANLEAFGRELDALEQELQQILQPVRKKPYFVFHEAFNYLEHSQRLNRLGVFAISDDVQPGARHVQQMREALKQAGPSCVFTEPPAPPRLLNSLSKDLPVYQQELDPLGSQATSYPELMRNLATAMHDCLSAL